MQPEPKRWRATRFFGGPLNGEYLEVEPSLGRHYECVEKQPLRGLLDPDGAVGPRLHRHLYRLHTFAWMPDHAVDIWVHESKTLDDVSRDMWAILAGALGVRPC